MVKKYDLKFNEKLTSNDTNKVAIFKNLERLEICYSEVTSIESNLFNVFNNLKYLKIEFYLLTRLPKSIFAGLEKLVELELFLNSNVKLNKSHFIGLQNLQILKVHKCEKEMSSSKIVFEEDFDLLVNLKDLQLDNVKLNKFSSNGLISVEKLYLVNLQFSFTRQIPKFYEYFFRNFKKLKYLEIFDFEQPLSSIIKEQKNLFKMMLLRVPASVESLKTNSSFFEYLNSESISFIYGLKSLELKCDKKIKKETLNFDRNEFNNLENLSIIWELTNTLSNPIFLIVKQIKKLKNLKILSLKGLILNGIDAELNHIIEATFSLRMPENILNFYNLENLCLENFTDKISIDENFLETLINLEELKIDNVFDAINDNVQFLFKSLIKLRKLTLNNNYIKILKSSFFEYLIDLEDLNLIFNETQEIEPDALKKLTNLKYLNLSCNQIKEFQKDLFVSNAKLQKIVLENLIN